MIKPGDKVVCIDDEWRVKSYQVKHGIPCPLVKGEVYTVIDFELWGQSARGRNRVNIVLQEVENPASPKYPYVGFGPWRFRKLLDISQSMEQLKAIARNPRQGIKV